MSTFARPLVALDWTQAFPSEDFTAREVAVGDFWIVKLRGFGVHSQLRCKVERIDGDAIFIVTADLADAGTRLVVDCDKLVCRG